MRIMYISLVIIIFKILCVTGVLFMLIVYAYLECVVSPEAVCDGDFLWLLSYGWRIKKSKHA